MLALEAGDCQFVFGWPAGAVCSGEGRRSVGRAAGYFFHVGQFLYGIWHADHNHAMMQQRRMKAGNSRFLPAVLCAGAGENAAELADQGASEPQFETCKLSPSSNSVQIGRKEAFMRYWL